MVVLKVVWYHKYSWGLEKVISAQVTGTDQGKKTHRPGHLEKTQEIVETGDGKKFFVPKGGK